LIVAVYDTLSLSTRLERTRRIHNGLCAQFPRIDDKTRYHGARETRFLGDAANK
jgi:hypothetical protein